MDRRQSNGQRRNPERALWSLLFAQPEVDPKHPPIAYSVQVQRDVPVFGFFGIAFLALLLPAIAITWRSINFERMRWAESDHPPIKIGNSED